MTVFIFKNAVLILLTVHNSLALVAAIGTRLNKILSSITADLTASHGLFDHVPQVAQAQTSGPSHRGGVYKTWMS